MIYQCSLEGYIKGCHAQLYFHNVDTLAEAREEIKTRAHLPWDENEEWICLLFFDKARAIQDGIPAQEIEDIWGNGRLFRWKPLPSKTTGIAP
jgi:hypothetical protein